MVDVKCVYVLWPQTCDTYELTLKCEVASLDVPLDEKWGSWKAVLGPFPAMFPRL